MTIIDNFNHTLNEAVEEIDISELENILTGKEDPRNKLNKLASQGKLPSYMSFHRLKDTPQGTEAHPEGDVWEHTLQVVSVGHSLLEAVDKRIKEDTLVRGNVERNENFGMRLDKWKFPFMLALLLHDIGKANVYPSPELIQKGEDLLDEWTAKLDMSKEDIKFHHLLKNKDFKKEFKALPKDEQRSIQNSFGMPERKRQMRQTLSFLSLET
jgi:hypothetical protein